MQSSGYTLIFLSRLYGGEHAKVPIMDDFPDFLSRLYGGEHARFMSTSAGSDFLSRLYGGERASNVPLTLPSISKPPVRR